MKKTTLSLVAAALAAASLGAYAAAPTGAAPFQVNIPNMKNGVTIKLEGLYLQPTSSNLSNLNYLSSASFVDFSSLAGTGATYAVDPDYALAFSLGLGYIFPNSGNDVQINWTHFDNDSDNSTVIGPDNIISGPVIAGFTDSLFTVDEDQQFTGIGSADFHYDAVDLDVGQYVALGSRLMTRFYAGLRYAQVKDDLTNTYSFIDSEEEFNLSEVNVFNSKFTGIGPRVGIDTNYHVANCFGVAAHLAAGLLVGQTESNASFNQTFTVEEEEDEVDVESISFNVVNDEQNRVVPVFDAKLGVNYTVHFNNGQSAALIEAGYQATEFVDAVDRFTVSGVNGNVFETSGVGFNGPYLTLYFTI